MSNRDGDKFEEFAPRDQGFSLLRTRGQTISWYARSAAVPAILTIVVLVIASQFLGTPKRGKTSASTTTTTIAQTTTTTAAPVTTSRVKKKKHSTPTTTTTPTKPVVTTTTKPPATTTTTRPPVTTTTTTVVRRRKPPTTTTTIRSTSYTITFTCSGGQSVTITGTGPSSSNTLTVTGPDNYSAFGQAATVSFTAAAGTYTATDHDAAGGAFINYASSGSTTKCS